MGFRLLENHGTDEWLEQRKHYLTATDMAKIRSGSEKAFRTLWNEKHSESSFRGNKYTEWGHGREPIIAEWVRTQLPGMRHNTSLAVSEEHPKFACTPDMLSEDGATVQIKTIMEKNDWKPGRVKSDYAAQHEWELIVLGKDEGMFAVETYRETATGFEPCEMRLEPYKSNPKLRKKLLDIAERFLSYEPSEIEEYAGDAGLEFIVDLAKDKTGEIAELEKRLRELKAERDGYFDLIVAELGESPKRVRFENALVEVTRSKPSERFDRKAFKADYPELEEKYTITGTSKIGVNIG